MPLYKDVQTADLRVCQDCRAVVPHEEETLHTRWHEDIFDALIEQDQLRQELASADLRAAGNGERCDAAIRVAEAARALHENRGKRGTETMQVHAEFVAALELWEQLR